MEILRDAGGKRITMDLKEQDLFMLLRKLEDMRAKIMKARRLPSIREKHEAQVLLGRCIYLEPKALAEIKRSSVRGFGHRPDQGRHLRERLNRLLVFFNR